MLLPETKVKQGHVSADPRDLIHVDNERGVKSYLTLEDDGKLSVHNVFNMDKPLRHAELERERNAQNSALSMVGNTQRHMQHVAEIPLAIFTLWKSVLGTPRQNPKAWARRLNDSQNAKFRVGGKTL